MKGGDIGQQHVAADDRVGMFYNSQPNLTADAGAILFGEAVTITADGPWQHLLYQLTGRKCANLDVENETGCGIVPYTYRPSNLVNPVPGAVALERFPLANHPCHIFLTPN